MSAQHPKPNYKPQPFAEWQREEIEASNDNGGYPYTVESVDAKAEYQTKGETPFCGVLACDKHACAVARCPDGVERAFCEYHQVMKI